MAHDRTYDHRDTEDCNTVALTVDIGRYAANTLLCDVLDDMFLRLAAVSGDLSHGFVVFGLDALIAPYDPAGALMGIFGIDAVVEDEGVETVALDAWIEAAVAEEQAASFSVGATIHGADVPVGQLETPIDDNDTVIVITNPGDFPATCPYQIQIGNEIMTVVGGCGTDTLTVVRGDNAAPHGAGSVVVTC